MSKRLQFVKYNDPGHGWLAVKRSLLIEYGLIEHITPYSYQRGQTVYLEEDSDASRLYLYLQSEGIEFDVMSKHTNSNSPIRSYAGFQFDPDKDRPAGSPEVQRSPDDLQSADR